MRTGSAFGISTFFHVDNVKFNKAEYDSYADETDSGNTTKISRCGRNVFPTAEFHEEIMDLHQLLGLTTNQI